MTNRDRQQPAGDEMIRLWIGYQALRFALWVMPKETGAVFEYVINDMMDMADDESRRPEIAELVRKAREATP